MMSVKVIYTKDGEEREVEFENEEQASIFMTGLRNHDHRQYEVKFNGVLYPEQESMEVPHVRR